MLEPISLLLASQPGEERRQLVSHPLRPGRCLCRRADEKQTVDPTFQLFFRFGPLSVVRCQLQRTTDN
jgi:hypothetical protein